MNTAKKDQLLKELDDQSIAKVEIDSIYKSLDKGNTGYISGKDAVVILNKLNAKIGIKEAKNDQWEWVLKQLKMSVDDDISKTDAMKIYKFVCNIAKDYLYCQ